MIVGDKNKFAIEYSITEAYSSRGLLGLGFFVVYLKGFCYGIRKKNATMLANYYDSVCERLNNRGKHIAPLFLEEKAENIALSLQKAFYMEGSEDLQYFGMSLEEFSSYLSGRNIGWDGGDEAFDDGSRILQFDEGRVVRIIGYKSSENIKEIVRDVREVFLDADEFYKILEEWRIKFYNEWHQKEKE